MANNTGWISIHRQIQSHWIWQDANKLKWWLDILLMVNNDDAKCPIGNELFICKRGESLLSIQSWATRWHVSKDCARNFLVLLERDKMIIRVNIGKTTRLTVCNYDSYQTELHVKKTVIVRKTNTNNNILSKDSNIDIRKSEFKNDLSLYLEKYGKDTLNLFYSYWSETNQSKTKMRFELEKTWELNLRLAKWKNNSQKKTDFKQQKIYNTYQGQEVGN